MADNDYNPPESARASAAFPEAELGRDRDSSAAQEMSRNLSKRGQQTPFPN